MRKKILFLSSTRGSNFKAVLDYIQAKQLEIEVLGLITDIPDAGCLGIAGEYGVPSRVIPFREYKENKALYHDKLFSALDTLSPDLIVTAGYMRILRSDIISRFKNRIINIHPSLLPSFQGLHAIPQAMQYGVRFTGCTTHFVEEGVDTGPIILQSIVEILPNSTESDLTESIHKEEHKILPLSVEYFCADRLEVSGRIVRIKESKP